MAVQEQYYGTVSEWYNQIRGTYWQSQSFIVQNPHNIAKVRLWIDKTGSSGLTSVTVEIYAADANHKPTGSVLASGTVLAENIQPAAYGDENHPTEIILSSPYPLAASTEYCIVARANTGSYYTYLFSSDTGYSGYHFSTTNSGGYWSTESDDLLFAEYDDQGAPQPPASITYPESDSHGEFEVSWDASEGAASYTLEQSDDDGVSWDEIYSGAGMSFFRNVDNGDYIYRVKAANEEGDSGYTEGDTITIDYTPVTLVKNENIAIKVSSCSGGV